MVLGISNTLAGGKDFFAKLLDIASSGYAILVYAILLLGIVAAVIVTLLVRDRKHAGGQGAGEEPVQVVVRGGAALGDAADEEEKPSEEGASRFDGLTRIDRERMKYEKEGYDEHITLRTVCERFRTDEVRKGRVRRAHHAAHGVRAVPQFCGGAAEAVLFGGGYPPLHRGAFDVAHHDLARYVGNGQNVLGVCVRGVFG